MFPSLKNNCLALAVIALIPSVGFANDVKVSGFIDPQMQWNNSASSPWFVLNDAAVYATASMGNVDVKIDLPFSASSTANNTFTWASTKAQAYFEMKHDNCKWKLGQFDTMFGNEGNDATDITSARQGIIRQRLTPVTHMGFMYSHNFGGQVMFNAIVADPNGKSSSAGTNLEFAGQLAFTLVPNFNFDVGYMMNKVATENATLMEVKAGYKADMWSLNAGLDMKKPATVGAETAVGMLAMFDVWSGDWSGSFRFENISKEVGRDKEMQITVGPQYAMAKNVKLKLDYTLNSSKALPTTVDATKTHAIDVAAVVKF